MKNFSIIGAFLIFMLVSCKKEQEDPIPFYATFSAIINNQLVTLTESTGSFWNHGAAKTSVEDHSDSTSIQYKLFLGARLKEDGYYKNSLKIDFVNHYFNSDLIPPEPNGELSENMFRESLKVGNYSYTFRSRVASGVIVQWYNSTGKFWATGRNQSENNGIPLSEPNYSNNSFEIINSIPTEVEVWFYDWAQELTINFNCFVYNNLGDSIWIENGVLNCRYSYRKFGNISHNKLANVPGLHY